MRITVTIGGVTALSRVLEGLGNGIKDWTPALNQSCQDIIGFIQSDVFDTEGDALGMPWEPLNPLYAAAKEHRYPGQQILVATGTMRDSFEALVNPTMATIGNSVEYFVYHQSSAPRTRLPRRVMLGLNEQVREMVVKNFQMQIQDAIAGVT